MRTLITLITFLLTLSVYSQSPSDTINYDDVNINYLETLLKEKLDNYRDKYDLPVLVWVDSISDGSRLHGKVMSEKNYLFHPESKYWNGETCGYVYDSEIVTYEMIASQAFSSIITSPPHRKILLYDDNTGGLGIFLNKERKRFYHVYRSDKPYDDSELALDNLFGN